MLAMKPFMQNYVIDIFDKIDSKRNKIFDDNICSHFVLFYNTEIFPLMNSVDDEILHKNYTSDENTINIYELVNSKSFRRMISNIKRIILFTELNTEISFNIDDYL